MHMTQEFQDNGNSQGGKDIGRRGSLVFLTEKSSKANLTKLTSINLNGEYESTCYIFILLCMLKMVHS